MYDYLSTNACISLKTFVDHTFESRRMSTLEIEETDFEFVSVSIKRRQEIEYNEQSGHVTYDVM